MEATYSVLASEDDVRGSSLSLTCNWKESLTLLSSPAPDAHAIAVSVKECFVAMKCGCRT